MFCLDFLERIYIIWTIVFWMGLKYFPLWFMIGFFVVLSGLSVIFVRVSRKSFSSGVLTGLWASIIILVVLFGIIALSIYVRRVRKSLTLVKK